MLAGTTKPACAPIVPTHKVVIVLKVTPDKLVTGIVFNIQKYSLHDGPGIRTIVFVKGCSLRCDWCSNPESQLVQIQLGYNAEKCLTVKECQRCNTVCTENALLVGADEKIVWDSERCQNCLECAEHCPTHALNTYGYQITVEDVLKSVLEDDAFFSRSRGGLTLSGGEPLFQDTFAIALLREARKKRIDTCIETCGNVPWKVLNDAAPHLNSIYYDIKNMDEEAHLKHTGGGNRLILDNLSKLKSTYPDLPVKVRVPVIKGFNDSEEAIGAILDFITPMPNVTFELLPYHRMGLPKYTYLGREYPMKQNGNPDEDRIEELRAFVNARLPGQAKS